MMEGLLDRYAVRIEMMEWCNKSNTKIKPSWTNIMISLCIKRYWIQTETHKIKGVHSSMHCCQAVGFHLPPLGQTRTTIRCGGIDQGKYLASYLTEICCPLSCTASLLHSWEFSPHTQEQDTKIQLNELNCHAGDGEQHCYFVQKHVKVLTWTLALLSFEAAHSY